MDYKEIKVQLADDTGVMTFEVKVSPVAATKLWKEITEKLLRANKRFNKKHYAK